ncbi:hypothetical protein [uncultured Desulfosarcina sp.]
MTPAMGHQPIHNEETTFWITFNGEIFNYPDGLLHCLF